MSTQNKNCFLAINGKKYGPISESDVQALFDRNKITYDTMFARKGMDKWIPLSKAGVIVDLEEDDLPPLPDSDIGSKNDEENNTSTPSKKWITWIAAISIGIIIAILADMGSTPQGTESYVQSPSLYTQEQATTPEVATPSTEMAFEISDFNGVFRGRIYPFDPMIVIIDEGRFFRYSRINYRDGVNTFMLFTGEIEGLRYEESDRIFAVDNMEWHDVHYDAITGEKVYHHIFNRPVSMEFIVIDNDGRLVVWDTVNDREYFYRIFGDEIPYFMNMEHLAHVLR